MIEDKKTVTYTIDSTLIYFINTVVMIVQSLRTLYMNIVKMNMFAIKIVVHAGNIVF